jgi:hypothetical protein
MALRETQPFTRPEAFAAGITVDQLAGPRYQRLFHGLYLPAQLKITVVDRARAALKISPAESYASHHTAAEIWGGWVPENSETHISVRSGLPRTKRRGIHAHRAPAAARAVRHRGLLLSPPMQTFLEMAAARLDLVDLVVLGDSLVKTGAFSPEELADCAQQWTGAGAALARRAASLVRSGVDSPTETRLRMLVVLAGLPEPQVNVVVRKDGGEWSRRFDLCYPQLKLIIEYDGRQHATDPKQWSGDIVRREELEAEGWSLIIVTADALFNRPTDTLRRITGALRARRCPGVPRRTPPVWHRHFRDRAGLT